MAYSSITYANLFADVLSWTDEVGEEFQSLFPGIVQLAETDVLRDLNLEGFRATMTAACTINNRVLAYPTGLIKTDSIMLTVAGKFQEIFYRSADFCRIYAPDVTVEATPKYYAEIDAGYYLAPTPDVAYVATIKGIKRPTGLSDANQSTWLSTNVPELLLRKTLLLSEQYLIAAAPVQKWKGEYMESMQKAREEFTGITHKEFAG